MTLYCFKCHSEVVFDAEHIGKNGRKIPLDPTTRRPHDCPERDKQFTAGESNQLERVDIQAKDDHGNEGFPAPPEQMKEVDRYLETKGVKPEYVDHTAKGTLKLKTITDPTPEGMDSKYNKLSAEYNVKFSQYHPLGSLYTIAVYYEEVK